MLKVFYSLEHYGISDVGLAREQNEDFWAAFPESGSFILADGMGGHNAGEVASQHAVHSLHALLEEFAWSENSSPEEIKQLFKHAFSEVSRMIFAEAQSRTDLQGMGTTLTALQFVEKVVTVGHVGDSRAYRHRDGKLKQLTTDHTVMSRMKTAIAKKEVQMLRHVLTRAIGIYADVKAEAHSFPVKPNDLYLLCSDGLTNYISNVEIEQGLNATSSLEELGQKFVMVAKQRGGSDNITAVFVRVGNDLP
ncbi:MAG: PP2C family protein-serine/threonine phosphatase [Chlamydiales bacterium]